MRHLHFDVLGGVAGDMFVAAMADAFPALRDEATRWAALLSGAQCAVLSHDDGTLRGARFAVTEPHHHDGAHGGAGHSHTHWAAIRRGLRDSALPEAAKAHAIGIFAELAEAEAYVHGRAVDEVAFHEVGAADSIADIVAAAVLIAGADARTCSVSSLPLGGGQVRTAHGIMPVLAPATARLLDGFAVHDDAIPGERVTPTGAAILRHLRCAGAARPAGTLRQTGTGFGTRRLPGISNCLRVLVSEDSGPEPAATHRDLAVVSFEVDDQSGEDLAAGLDRVRALPGVHDVVQMAAFGKKNRLAVHVQVLGRPDALEAIAEACFRETTTIGLRTHLVQARALPRRMTEVALDDRTVRVKWVERPGGATGKAEAADLAGVADHAARQRIRRDAERLAEPETAT